REFSPLSGPSARPLLQLQFPGDPLHGVDDELDVLGQVDAEVGGAAVDVLALDRAGEAFRLQLLLDAGGGQVGDAGGADQGVGAIHGGSFLLPRPVAGLDQLPEVLAARSLAEVLLGAAGELQVIPRPSAEAVLGGPGTAGIDERPPEFPAEVAAVRVKGGPL